MVCAVCLLAGCSDRQGTADAAVPTNATLTDTLNSLGVETDLTPRLDDRGDPYPDSYAPMGTVVAMRALEDTNEPSGKKYVIGRPDELLLGGFRPDARPGVLTVIDDLSSGTETNGITVSDYLFEKNMDQAPWAVERNTGGNSASGPRVVQGTRRDASAGDFNGDGFRETAIAYYAEYANLGGQVRLLVSDAKAPNPSEIEVAVPISSAFFPVNDLRVATGDFDGDQRDEIAIVVSRMPESGVPDTPVGVYLVDDESTGFAFLQEFTLPLKTNLSSPNITLAVKSARLDLDSKSELVLVANENTQGPSYPGAFATQYLALEYGAGGLAVLSSGPIVARVNDTDHTAVVADVATGDLDGDSVDELIFAGLEEIVGNCASQDTSVDGLKHLLVGLGNRYNDFAQVGASASAFRIPNCDDSHTFLLRFTHVNTLDFDGDGDLDIQVNHLVFDGFPTEDWSSGPLGQIPDSTVILGFQEQGTWYDRSNSAMAVSDQTGDGVADLITLLLDQNQPVLNVWTCTPDPNTGRCVVSRATTVALWPEDMNTIPSNVPANDTSHMNPMVVPVDVDNDDVLLFKYTNQHLVDFTEPIVLAALAAPPCELGIGQNTDACTTTWGSAASATIDQTFNVTVKGAISFGSGTAGAGAIAKSKHTLSAEVSHEQSKSYELTTSRLFTSGPLEDSVVFTSIPMDRYVYETIASSDPGDIGTTYTANLPREAIMLITTREFYNQNVQPDALHIDDRVFQHVPGRISSYPTASDKDLILVQQRDLVEVSRANELNLFIGPFEPWAALPGLTVGPISVGQGSGETELALEYVETEGVANALELAYEYEAETAAGLLVGFSVGVSGARSLTISHGDSSLYSGTIGSIDAANFADHRYQFGLFTYLQALEGQEFEVVNYWVETNSQ
jgi:hypothetical protein